MMGKKTYLQNLRQCEIKVTATNYDDMQAVAIGTAEIKMKVDGTSHLIKVENVLYIPGLAANLFSAEKISKKKLQNTNDKR